MLWLVKVLGWFGRRGTLWMGGKHFVRNWKTSAVSTTDWMVEHNFASCVSISKLAHPGVHTSFRKRSIDKQVTRTVCQQETLPFTHSFSYILIVIWETRNILMSPPETLSNLSIAITLLPRIYVYTLRRAFIRCCAVVRAQHLGHNEWPFCAVAARLVARSETRIRWCETFFRRSREKNEASFSKSPQ